MLGSMKLIPQKMSLCLKNRDVLRHHKMGNEVFLPPRMSATKIFLSITYLLVGVLVLGFVVSSIKTVPKKEKRAIPVSPDIHEYPARWGQGYGGGGY